MSLNVKNCPQCGKVFAIGMRDICPDCSKEIDEQYERCYEYLRDNRSATMNELSKETGVSVIQITKFIREGRISIGELANMNYPCDVCGKQIRKGFMCDECRQRFVGAVDDINKEATEKKERDEALRQSYEIRNK